MPKARTVYGFRFTASEYYYARLSGTKTKPKLLDTGSGKCPKGSVTSSRLNWFKQEIDSIFDHTRPDYVVIKSDESRNKKDSSIERAYNEAMLFLALSDLGLPKTVTKKRKVTIAKDLAGKGVPALISTLDTSFIADFESLDEKIKDSILCGWAGL